MQNFIFFSLHIWIYQLRATGIFVFPHPLKMLSRSFKCCFYNIKHNILYINFHLVSSAFMLHNRQNLFLHNTAAYICVNTYYWHIWTQRVRSKEVRYMLLWQKLQDYTHTLTLWEYSDLKTWTFFHHQLPLSFVIIFLVTIWWKKSLSPFAIIILMLAEKSVAFG